MFKRFICWLFRLNGFWLFEVVLYRGLTPVLRFSIAVGGCRFLTYYIVRQLKQSILERGVKQGYLAEPSEGYVQIYSALFLYSNFQDIQDLLYDSGV